MTRTDLDLANRALGGSVRAVSDELFAPVESLIQPAAPVHDPAAFGPHGKIYDGWESRRRRGAGDDDWVIVALGIPGVLHEIIVDTAFFRGNYPPEITVQAARLEPADDPLTADWTVVVPRSPAEGDSQNHYEVSDPGIFTHVRLIIHPDGGVARLRVLGRAVPDPRLLGGRIDLAALANGGDIAECSDMFYSDARNTLLPGGARSTGEGWENQRRRGAGNDYLVVALAGPARLAWIDLDTRWFIGNAPGSVSVSVRDGAGGWREVLGQQPVSTDGANRFRLPPDVVADAVRVDVYPDGGLSRVHVYGELLAETLTGLVARWLGAPPDPALLQEIW
jgi:allantoicase